MAVLAILDDRREVRETLVRSLRTALPKDWECILCPLLKKTTDYPEWLLNHKVQVLLADQVLNEQAPDSTGTADYKGHDVTTIIRKSIPNLPIYIVTAYPDDRDLPDHFGDVEDVFRRRELTKDPKRYVRRMLRAGQRFEKEHNDQVEQLAELAVKVASGKASANDKKQLHTLQVALSTPSALDIDQSREKALEAAEDELRKVQKIRKRIEKLLKTSRQ